jgi:DNA polymerase III delta prime subunit
VEVCLVYRNSGIIHYSYTDYKGVGVKKLYFYTHALAVFLGAAWSAWLTLAVCTYHADDSSLFFLTTHVSGYGNWCGYWGAHASALLFFLCGSATYLVLLFFWALVYMLYHRCIYIEKDRLCALLCGALVGSIYESYRGAHWFLHGFLPGGVLGNLLNGFLSSRCDPVLMGGMVWLSSYIAFLLTFQADGVVYLAKLGGVLRAIFAGTVSTALIQSYFYKKYTHVVSYMHRCMRTLNELFGVAQDCTLSGEYKDFMDVYHDAYTAQDKDTNNSHTMPEISSLENLPPEQHQESLLIESVPLKTATVKKEPYKKDAYALALQDIFFQTKQPQAHERAMEQEQQGLAKKLEEKLLRFGIAGSVVSIKTGPVVTLFEYEPHIDAKVSRILALEDDLALALEATSIRIIAPIPGTKVVGFEVARKEREHVFFDRLITSKEYQQKDIRVPLVLGVDTTGKPAIADLAAMPHLLVAGSTGSGKSVALHAFLASLLSRFSPHELKLVLIDPKRLEFAPYADIAHLLFPIITESHKALLALRWLVRTMEERYALMASSGTRNIIDFNEHCVAHNQEPFSYIILIIDELADLMMTTGKDIELYIARLAQMARAAGIHIIIATQRPSVDVITGIIKANFPSRISFRVATKVDARTILDQSGAEKLLGKGDMLYLDATSRVHRVHGAYISNKEIEKLVAYIRQSYQVAYCDLSSEQDVSDNGLPADDKKLYEEILAYLDTVDEISISSLQRAFNIGYNRSARLMEFLESQGRVLNVPGNKMRKVLRNN